MESYPESKVYLISFWKYVSNSIVTGVILLIICIIAWVKFSLDALIALATFAIIYFSLNFLIDYVSAKKIVVHEKGLMIKSLFSTKIIEAAQLSKIEIKRIRRSKYDIDVIEFLRKKGSEHYKKTTSIVVSIEYFLRKEKLIEDIKEIYKGSDVPVLDQLSDSQR